MEICKARDFYHFLDGTFRLTASVGIKECNLEPREMGKGMIYY